MIPKTATLEVRRVPLDQLVIGENLTRDTRRVLAYSNLLSNDPDHDMEPVIVEPAGKDLYRLTNGHHRFVAAIISGRPDLLSIVVTPPTQEFPLAA